MTPPSSGSVRAHERTLVERRPAPDALRAADLELSRGRHAAALALVERALSREPSDEDLRARLHLARGHALWLSGRTRAGAAEVERVGSECREDLTRARALETLGLIDWKAHELDRAGARLAEAHALWARPPRARGATRALCRRAGLLRDSGRLVGALNMQAEAIVAGLASGREDVLAEARAGRAGLLAALGRWTEAREEVSEAAALFRAAGDPREHTWAGLCAAVVELAAGELGAARESLARARAAVCPDGSDPRTSGEIALLECDLVLAEGDAQAALAQAGEALALFSGALCAEGETRARMRLVHCLLAFGRRGEAVTQARRAVESAGRARPDLRALALIAAGRAQLGADAAAAARAFEDALAHSAGRPSFEAAARLGVALARGRGRGHPEVTGPLAALEAWGDRRFLAQCLAAIEDALGHETASPAACAVAAGEGEDGRARALAQAALALASSEAWPARWAAAMRAVLPVLPWWRAVLTGEPGWELRRDLEAPRPLRAGDLALRLAPRELAPFVADLAGDPVLRRHPQRVLHRLGKALVAPVGAGAWLHLDLREGHDAGAADLPLLSELARLVEPHRVRGDGRAAEAGPAPAAFGQLVGGCPAMQSLVREAARVAPLGATVHIYGETGTGKECLARALHLGSPRGRGPWVPVNASSLSDDLFESEMFGHVKGAFTGALADRRGYVAEAEGGTLFLDEVTDLSARGQAKLLRFLQEREYRRVGDPRLCRADVRVVTASNVPLEEQVAAGRFRADLMYRLNQHVLALPPLRERGEDVALLARHCLREAARRAGVPAPALSREAAAALTRHAWPGNVRELESEMGRALARCEGGVVRAEHLSLALARPSPARVPLRQAVDAFEREHIGQALRRNLGNRSRTAVELGLSRQALLAKISRLGIASAPPR